MVRLNEFFLRFSDFNLLLCYQKKNHEKNVDDIQGITSTNDLPGFNVLRYHNK